jgi:hypothetical protein
MAAVVSREAPMGAVVRMRARESAWGVEHATWQHLYPTRCGACWRALRALPLMLLSSNALAATLALWICASGYLGTPWHTKAGGVAPWEVVGPPCSFTVKRMSMQTLPSRPPTRGPSLESHAAIVARTFADRWGSP